MWIFENEFFHPFIPPPSLSLIFTLLGALRHVCVRDPMVCVSPGYLQHAHTGRTLHTQTHTYTHCPCRGYRLSSGGERSTAGVQGEKIMPLRLTHTHTRMHAHSRARMCTHMHAHTCELYTQLTQKHNKPNPCTFYSDVKFIQAEKHRADIHIKLFSCYLV